MLKVVELFAGVGGFRLGLEGWNGKSALSNYTKKLDIAGEFQVVWSNQFEPSTKFQHASKIYEGLWGSEGHSNEDIAKVVSDKFDMIPDHDVLVGGFPCQDYSVASVLSNSKGIVGKKGVLWWEIYNILRKKGEAAPNYLILENVDRLINSPASQRGRDFAIILACLADLDYAVEWQVINAADYGLPQKRRRTFIVGYKKGSPLYSKLIEGKTRHNAIENGVLADSFPTIVEEENSFKIEGNIQKVSSEFNLFGKRTPFLNKGMLVGRNVITQKTKADKRFVLDYATLGDLLVPANQVEEEYWVSADSLEKWEYLKGGKSEMRKRRDGGLFKYAEGAMSFPDPLDQPARTIITSEGGKSPARSKHVIKQNGKLRRLVPVELERANQFPDDHTLGVLPAKRAFLMGNALVVGVVEKIGRSIIEICKIS